MSSWNEDRLARLKHLWPQGRSAARIARDLGGGLTRNAVLGQVRRLGLSTGDRRRPERPGPPTAVAAVAPPTGSVSILNVRRTDCRWPYGDPSEVGFSLCGQRVSHGAYCDAHAAVAYRPGRDTPQSLERLARLT